MKGEAFYIIHSQMTPSTIAQLPKEAPDVSQKDLFFQSAFKAVAEGSFKDASGISLDGVKIRGYASTNDLDRGNDVVEPKAFEESIRGDYANNPIILFQHNANQPIGKATSMSIDSKGLVIEAIIYDEKIGNLIKQGVLRTFSIGYRIKEVEYRDMDTDEVLDPENQEHMVRIWLGDVKRVIKKLELFENSVVSIPMNQSALFSLQKSIASAYKSCADELIKNNPDLMTKHENLLEKKEEEVAAEEVAVEEAEEPIETTETPEGETATEEAETVEETEEAEAEAAEDETSPDSEGDETSADAEEEAPEEVEEPVEDGEKALVTEKTLRQALQKAVEWKGLYEKTLAEKAALEEKVAKLQKFVNETPSKQALAYGKFGLSESDVKATKPAAAPEQPATEESKFSGFKSAFSNAAQ